MDMNYEEKLAIEISDRKSITNWTEQACSIQVWNLLIEAARRSPSSWNQQPARYILIKEKHQIRRLCNAFHRTNQWAAKAAGLIIQIANPNNDDRIDGKDYYLYDCGLAMMSLVYQAQVMGLTSRQMIGWDEAEVKRFLNIPEAYRIVVITAIGYPSISPVSRAAADLKRQLTQQHKRYQSTHLFFWETWNGVNGNEDN